MSEVIWKAFRLDNLFELSGAHKLSKTAKQYNPVSKPTEGYIANVTAGKFNNGIVNYLPIDNEILQKKVSNYLTIASNGNGGAGTCFYHDYDIVSTGHNALLHYKNEKLKELFVNNKQCAQFAATIITTIFANGIFNQTYAVTKDTFPREIILLPCLEVAAGEDYIWEENGRHYTLAVDYIKKLMDEAKELREQKTIRLYEAEKAKYEAEKAKYEAEYLKEKPLVSWKSFSLDSLFVFDSRNQLSTNKKALNISNEKDNEHPIALITQSEKNNGISGFLEKNSETELKKMNNYLTYSMHFGLCFYHDYDFVLMDTHGSVFRLIAKQEKLKKEMNSSKELNLFLAKTITKVCRNGIYNYSWLPNSTRVGREIILLPCLEVAAGEDYIWEENGRHYTLAINYISYLYLSGKVNYNQKLIDNYTYQY